MFRHDTDVGPGESAARPSMMSSISSGVSAFLKKMYGLLFGSLIIAGVSSYIGMQFAFVKSLPVMLIMAIIGFVLVWIISRHAIDNPVLGLVGLAVFSVVDGLSLSALLAMYSGYDVTEAFICSSAVFGGMSLIGFTTHKDLSHMGTQLFGALIGLIIASIVSLFFASTLMDIIINIAGVIIFSGFSIYDTHEAVQSYDDYSNVSSTGLAVFWALSLYLDFENLFLDILELIGNANNNN